VIAFATMSASARTVRVWHGEKEREVFELYSEDLDRLTMNSKPVISNLTELAEEYRVDHAPLIVRIIEDRIRKVPPEQMLPQLYLLDSIIKNHTDPYAVLFQQNIVSVFASVFKVSNEKIRAQLFKLRGTWNIFFAHQKLNQLDRRIREIDPAWPMMDPKRMHSAPPAPASAAGAPRPVVGPHVPMGVQPGGQAHVSPIASLPNKIHVNPKIVNPDYIRAHKLGTAAVVTAASAAIATTTAAAPAKPAIPAPVVTIPAPVAATEPQLDSDENEIKAMREQLEKLRQTNLKMHKEKLLKEIAAEEKKLKDNSKTMGKGAATTNSKSSASTSVKVCKIREICPIYHSSFQCLPTTA